MEYSRRIARSIIDYHEKNRLKFTTSKNENRVIIKVPMNINDAETEIDYVDNDILVTNLGFYCCSTVNVYIEPNRAHNILMYISLINYELHKSFCYSNGGTLRGFSFDALEGKIHFIQSQECGDKYLSDDEVEFLIHGAAWFFSNFSASICDVLNGNKTPEDAAAYSVNRLNAILSDVAKENNTDIYEHSQNSDSFNNSYNYANETHNNSTTYPVVSRNVEFHTKVAGVSFDGRQRIIRQTRVGESLSLVREPNNPYDRNAIMVLNGSGNQLGFIPKEIASTLASDMDSGSKYIATVTAITGTNPGDTMGVNILVKQI